MPLASNDDIADALIRLGKNVADALERSAEAIRKCPPGKVSYADTIGLKVLTVTEQCLLKVFDLLIETCEEWADADEHDDLYRP